MLSFTSPLPALVALAVVSAIVAIALLRRVDLPLPARVAMLLGLLALALAAGGVAVHVPQRQWVAVMVDVSPSTRTASFRDAGQLEHRVNQLLGRTAYRVFHFAQDRTESTIGAAVAEQAADETRFSAPADAHAVLLFSDGQFVASVVAQPTYPVIDPGLERPADARVAELEVRDQRLAAAVEHAGAARELRIAGAAEASAHRIESSRTVTAGIPASAGAIVARLNSADAWPENDALAIYPPPPARLQRWWVGDSPPDATWTALAPPALPVDAAALLDAGAIVLANVPASALSAAQHERLVQYVRDLGGSLIILGGERAFAAGGYHGTHLDLLSPLSSTPPEPARQWVILVDSSGSMAARAGDATRWELASRALSAVLPTLPPEDRVRAGSFAHELRWWMRGAAARDLQTRTLIPPDLHPHGPTNLQPAIESVLAATDSSMPIELLLISDADTKVDVDALAPRLQEKQVRLHLLATAEIATNNAVRRLAAATGGTIRVQADPQRWADDARQLARSAAPEYLQAGPQVVRFIGPLAALPEFVAGQSNLLWPKAGSTALALAEGPQPVLAATWQVGSGRVLAAGFAADAPQADAMASLVAQTPRDPRLAISWAGGSRVSLTVVATDEGRPLNDHEFELSLHDAVNPEHRRSVERVPQTAPGTYATSLPAPLAPMLAILRHEGRIVERRALAARYPREFDAIGNHRDHLTELASQSGGRIIEPHDAQAIDFAWPRTRVDLSGVLAGAGAVLIAAGLCWWRLR